QWIETSALHALLEQDQVLATAELHGLAWSGWCSVAPAALAAISTHCDQANFAATMCNAPVRLRLLEQSHFASARSARELMKAQQLALAQSHLDAVPATWIRTPWGAHAPDAVVQVGAELEGPALIGPRCYVSAGARIGAGTILTHDVVVSPAASVSHSVVLPHTLVGEGLELEDCIVNAGRFHNVRLDAHAYVASADGLLLDLQRKPGSGVPWVSRLVAAVLCLVLLPWIAIDALLGRLAGKPARWSKRNAVTGRDEISHAIRQVPLRCPKPGQKGVAALLSQYGAWLDVALGLRSWFGQRPRSQSEWYALSRDWQTILSAVPVGCLHAPAWTETGESAAESEAVADVYFAYNNRFKEKLRILVRSGFPGKRSLAVRIP
ncbi:MAG: hypothetical protein K9K38_10780, partial [Rhodoferax sp.]|nr:hypothetical protein [Rhodoferax sp.]